MVTSSAAPSPQMFPSELTITIIRPPHNEKQQHADKPICLWLFSFLLNISVVFRTCRTRVPGQNRTTGCNYYSLLGTSAGPRGEAIFSVGIADSRAPIMSSSSHTLNERKVCVRGCVCVCLLHFSRWSKKKRGTEKCLFTTLGKKVH